MAARHESAVVSHMVELIPEYEPGVRWARGSTAREVAAAD